MGETSDFWSRRRAGVEAETRAEAARAAETEAAKSEAALAARPDEEILEELDLPQPEALETPDEVQAFLKAAVPQRLKQRALRRLWRLNPVLANLDGLVDYGEDYTDAATVVENLQTAYEVGKGMLGRFEEALDDIAEADAPEAAPLDDPDEEPAQIAEVAAATALPPAPIPFAEPDPEPAAAPQRRMRFHFVQPTPEVAT